MRIDITIDYDPNNQAESIAIDKIFTVLANSPGGMCVTPIKVPECTQPIAEPQSRKEASDQPETAQESNERDNSASVGAARLRSMTSDQEEKAAMLRKQYRAISKEKKLHPDVHELLKEKHGSSSTWTVGLLEAVISMIRFGVTPSDEEEARRIVGEWMDKEYDQRTQERELSNLVKGGSIEHPWLMHCLLCRLDTMKIWHSMKEFSHKNMLKTEQVQFVWENSTTSITRTMPNWKVWMSLFEGKAPDKGTVEDYKYELSENPKAGSTETLIKWIKGQRGNPRTCIGLVFAYNEFQQNR